MTSTTLLMGLAPAIRRRFCIHQGDGPTSTSSTNPRYLGHNSCSCTSSLNSKGVPSYPLGRLGAFRNGSSKVPRSPAYPSRACPTMDMASGRFVVTSKSITISLSNSSAWARGSPIFGSLTIPVKSQMPMGVASLGKPISSAAHIMPWLSCPRT